MAKILPPNSYFIKESSKGIEIIYVTPCGNKLLAAIVTRKEMKEENPGVEILHPLIGINGFIKIAKVLKDWLKSRK